MPYGHQVVPEDAPQPAARRRSRKVLGSLRTLEDGFPGLQCRSFPCPTLAPAPLSFRRVPSKQVTFHAGGPHHERGEGVLGRRRAPPTASHAGGCALNTLPCFLKFC